MDFERIADNMQLVSIKYQDHLLFRRSNARHCLPNQRECVGWLCRENGEAVWIVWDRSVRPLPHERINTRELGLVIVKSNILEMKEIEL